MTMNTFYEHHEDSIRFAYRCFDRILINGLIQPFQQPERVVGFFNTYRQLYPVSKPVLKDIATQYQRWVTAQAKAWRAPIVEAPTGRRDAFVEPYFRRAKPDQVMVIVKGREPARILTAIGKADRWHLQYARRWIDQYNFYLHDAEWGRMFVRLCPYFPFSARVCLNQHHWLATRMRAEGIRFRQESNAFLTCSDSARLQALADSLTARDIAHCAQKWLRTFTPFFTPTERRTASCQHRLFFAQVEYADNLIFDRRAALDALGERLLDANRTIGQPTKLANIFGRKVTKRYRGKLETLIEDLDLPNPVIRSYYRDGSIKQYVRDHLLLRTEATSNNVRDFGIPKAIDAVPHLRQAMAAVTDRYQSVQQDILETFVDRGQLRQLAEPTRRPNGKRVPGLKLDHPRQLALMHALVRFAHIAAGDTFTTRDLHAPAAAALDATPDQYRLASLRYDLSKLRAKGLVERVPQTRRYRLLPPRLHHLPRLLETLRTRVRPADRRPARARRRRRASRGAQTSPTRSAVSTNRQRPRRAPARRRTEDGRLNGAHNEYRILIRDRITG
jgi:hypothetical protein